MNIQDGIHDLDRLMDKYDIPLQTPIEKRAIFDAMEMEQYRDYQDYVRRCGGTPVSTVKPSVPHLRSNVKLCEEGGK